jgi:excisionase family DNA binding protein
LKSSKARTQGAGGIRPATAQEIAAYDTEHLVSPRIAALRLGVSRSLIYKLCRKKQIPHYQLGSALRVNLAEVCKLMRRESDVAPSDPAA